MKKRNEIVTLWTMFFYGIFVALATKVLYIMYTISEWGRCIELDCPWYDVHSFQFFKMEFINSGFLPIYLAAGIAVIFGIMVRTTNKCGFLYYATLSTIIVSVVSVVQCSHIISRWWDYYIIRQSFKDYIELAKTIVFYDCLPALISVIIVCSGLMTVIHFLMNNKHNWKSASNYTFIDCKY